MKRNIISKRLISIITAIFICFTMTAVIVQADTTSGKNIYVAADGSDDSGDGSESNPYRTINHAYDQSSANDTILLLTDIEQSEMVGIWHSITIDGQGYSVIRQEGFAAANDSARSDYNPAMFEAHSDEGDSVITFKNITLDDSFRHQGSKYQDQAISPADTSDNINRVQDGIISLYESPNNYKTTVILDDGCTLQNFGGFSGVNIEGKSELVMKSGSLITNGNTGTSGSASGVYALAGGTLTMEPGSLITGISGSYAVYANEGTANINGEISYCSAVDTLRTVKSEFNIGTTANVHHLTGTTAALYDVGGSTITIAGKFTDMSGVGIYPSNNSGLGKVYIVEGAEIARCASMAVQTNLGSEIYMSGGSIHDNPIAIHARKQSQVYISGGKIENNDYGVFLNKKSTNIARVFVTENADITGNNTVDYYIESTETGYENGSFIYFDRFQTTKEPDIQMELNDKDVKIKASDKEMHIGNASATSKNALSNEADRLGLTNKLATWWFDDDQKLAEFLVSHVSHNIEPMYALYVPVNADGTTAGDVYCIRISQDMFASLSTSANADGYSVMLAQADVPTFTITIEYKDENGNVINDPYSDEFVENSNYDLSAFISPDIKGYSFVSASDNPAGTASNNKTITSTYNKLKEITVKADDKSKYVGESDPELTATVIGPEDSNPKLNASIRGLKDGDSINYTLSRESGEEPGKYTITVQGDEIQGDYIVKYIDGTFTISDKDSGNKDQDEKKIDNEDDKDNDTDDSDDTDSAKSKKSKSVKTADENTGIVLWLIINMIAVAELIIIMKVRYRRR